MKRKIYFFLITFLVWPFIAFASGNDIIPTFYLIIITAIIFMTALIAFKINTRIKTIIALVYICVLGIVFLCIADLPFTENRILINLSLSLGPTIIASITYLFITRTITKN